ncbi:MAG: hypothetical protein ACI857_001391 [Arenicella sp.]|jgi:hypothetical protein
MRAVIILVFGVLILVGCEKDPEPLLPFVPVTCSDIISYNNEIVPQIIDLSCNVTGCHDATAAADWELTSHALVSANTDPLYRVMAQEAGYVPMPLNQERIADSLLQKFYCWIQQGRLDN